VEQPKRSILIASVLASYVGAAVDRIEKPADFAPERIVSVREACSQRRVVAG
jgi:hypothetical protein